MTAIQKLKETLLILQNATCPEDVFGATNGEPEEEVKARHRDLIKIVFVDHYKRPDDKKIAEEGFQLLNKWHALAKKKIAEKTYGDRATLTSEITISTKTDAYTLKRRVASGDICEIYRGTNKAGLDLIFKVPRNPANSDLLVNEAKRLKYVKEESAAKGLKILVHLPELIDSFDLQQSKAKKRVNVFKYLAGYYSLAEVIDEYPTGIDIKDAAWMFNRLLGSLGAAFRAGIVHGAVIPSNILICPETHNGVLIDWCYSVGSGHLIRAISPKNKAFYPPEVLDKKPVNSGCDIYMLTRCLATLVTGTPVYSSNILVPRAIRGFINACLLGKLHRPKNPFEVHKIFGETLQELYGPRKWRDFHMPRVAA